MTDPAPVDLLYLASEIPLTLVPVLPFHPADDTPTEALLDLRRALRGDPREPGDKGAIGALSDLARDVDNAVLARMSGSTEVVGEWQLERHTSGRWTFDAPRLVGEFISRRLLEHPADRITGEVIDLSPAALDVVVRAVCDLVDVSKARVTPIRQAFGDDDAPSKFGKREHGAPRLTVTPAGDAA